MKELDGLRTAHDIRNAIVTGQVSAQEILRATLDQIDHYDGHLHSFLTVDAEHATRQVDELEARRRAGEVPGPFWGVPFSVKDVYDTKAMRTTYGSRAFRDHVPDTDAVLVQRIRRAGGILVGKTNTPEFAIYIRTDNDLMPETVNPWDLARTCGGSSGGAAASVAAGFTTIAVGSDGGGSTRIPAALCGVVGLKPTFGSIPGTGGYIGTRRFSSAGPITRDADDAEALWRVMQGPDAIDPALTLAPMDTDNTLVTSARPPVRLRWIGDSGVSGSEPDVVAATREAAVALAATIGTCLDDPCLSLNAPEYSDAFYDIMQADRVSTGGAEMLHNEISRELLTSYALHQFERGSLVTGAQYSAAVQAQMHAVDHVEGLLAGVDAVITPTLGYIAPEIPQNRSALPEDARRGFVAFTFLMNFTGLPAISIPCGFVRGMPVGIQVFGRPGTEPLLLDLARHYQDFVYRMPQPEIVTMTKEPH